MYVYAEEYHLIYPLPVASNQHPQDLREDSESKNWHYIYYI